MLIIPPVMYRKRRSRKPRAVVAGPALIVVGVEDIVQEDGTLALTAVFDTTAGNPLVGVDEAVASKWQARYTENLYQGASLVQLAFDRVRISFTYGDYVPGAPNDLTYLADPSDISDAGGRTLAAFVLGIE